MDTLRLREGTLTVFALVATSSAAVMSFHAGMPWFSVVALPGLGIGFALFQKFNKPTAACLVLALSGLVSSVIPFRTLFGADEDFATNWASNLCSGFAWGLCVSLVAALLCSRVVKQTVLAFIALTIALVCGSLWVGTAYLHALPEAFYLSIAPVVCVIQVLKERFGECRIFVQVANTCLLILVGIPLVDLFWKPPQPTTLPFAAQRFFSYELARKDPVAFERWWQFFMAQTSQALREVLQEDTRRLASARTIPGAEAQLFDSKIRINQLGFRGPEITKEKRGAYRIVALGESTTFGLTLAKDDRPWPTVLEGLIREHAGLSRKVEVINAGLPSFTIQDNVRRFEADIAPLEPDMILSYHGYNGFDFLDGALPTQPNNQPPVFRARALRLLQQAEYRVKLLLFRRSNKPKLDPCFEAAPVTRTKFAELYQQLYALAKKHSATLVLASFSMAVNGGSDPDVIEFYRLGFPSVSWSILANQSHTELVRAFVQSHPDVLYVDTQPGLDGHHQNFIDLVHLTQTGRNHIARRFYEVIEPALKEN